MSCSKVGRVATEEKNYYLGCCVVILGFASVLSVDEVGLLCFLGFASSKN